MKPDRRAVLLGGAGAAFLGQAHGAPVLPGPPGGLPMGHLAVLKNYRAQRASSADRTGGNADFVRVEPGATVSLLEASGPAMVTHFWCTIASSEDFHLKKLVIRAYWDGESEPSIEAPVGDLFGLSLGEYFLYQSALTTVSSIKAMNAYFTMPFAKSGRITVTNEGEKPAGSFYFNIDYVSFKEMPPDLAYFHAQYRQETPCRGWTDDWRNNYEGPAGEKKNLNGEGNYIFAEMQGRGHFVGVTHGVVQNQEGWFGEGDEMIFIDNNEHPLINGTGTEDYYNGAWDFGGLNGAVPFSYWRNGAPYMVNSERIGGRYCLYRWHLEDPIPFEKSLKVTIEHGHANHRSDSFFSTAYWYQTEPHSKFPTLPAVADRIPRVMAVGGPGALKR